MKDDADLLRRYVEDRSEDAFTELVRRHLGLVYATALRRVGGDTHLAEDVAQKVFADLARKAATLRDHATLGGWLYVSTQVAAAAVVRSEQRRKTRETGAQIMETLSAFNEADPNFDHLRPVLDDALLQLKAGDREAIVLRFLQQRTFADIGTTLRLTEDAARKRVDRALEKLRTLLGRRGIKSTSVTLGLALAASAIPNVPAVLATKVAGQALAQATALGTGASAAFTLAKALLLPAAALVIGGIFLLQQHQANAALRTELAQLAPAIGAIDRQRAINLRLARLVADVERLRSAQTELPGLHRSVAAIVPPPVRVAASSGMLTITSTNGLRWENEPVDLQTYLSRLQSLQPSPAADSKIVISAPGATFDSLSYVIDEARKAQIKHVVVESDATPDPKRGFSWF